MLEEEEEEDEVCCCWFPSVAEAAEFFHSLGVNLGLCKLDQWKELRQIVYVLPGNDIYWSCPWLRVYIPLPLDMRMPVCIQMASYFIDVEESWASMVHTEDFK